MGVGVGLRANRSDGVWLAHGGKSRRYRLHLSGVIDLARITRSGVCYDLRNSPYESELGCFRLKFSSISHKLKFDSALLQKQLWMNDSMSRRFHCDVSLDLLTAFHWYRQVETRGFYVYDFVDDVEHTDMSSFEFRIVM